MDLVDCNPVARVKSRSEAADTRKVRRSLTISEGYGLLDVSAPRRLFYAVALWVGLRVDEIRSLEWRDVHLEGDRPCIRLRASTTKAKRADEMPLHADLAAMLRDAKPPFAKPMDRVLRTVPRLTTFKRDLERAEIAFEDDQGRTVDRHALRTTFISWLGQYGVDPRAQIRLARHAPRGITLRSYQDFSVFHLWAEIAKLPGAGCPETAMVRATGTGDARGVVRGVVPI